MRAANPGNSQPQSRSARAAAALAVGVDELAEGVCDFAGVPRVRGDLGSELVRRTLMRLEQIPQGVIRTVCDLSDAAESINVGDNHIPPIPDPVVDAVAYIDVLVSRLSARELHCTAIELGITRSSAIVACFTAAPWRHVAKPDIPTAAIECGGALDTPPPRNRAVRIVDHLATTEPEQWDLSEVMVLRLTLRQHLADIGDALLRVSEWSAPTLNWQPQQNMLVAVQPVPGAPNPLEARIISKKRRPDQPDSNPELFDPQAGQPVTTQFWEVGWRDDSGQFVAYGERHECTLAAARFAAQVTIAQMANRADTLRMRFTGELFVPRTNARNTDAEVINLRDVLVATMSQHRSEVGEQPTGWRMRPHRTPDEDLGSVVAAIFDHLGLPSPHLGDPACDAQVDSPIFTAFLARHAFTLSVLARRYLAGMADAGPGERSLGDRHAAGFRAVLQNDVASDWLALELEPPDHEIRELVNVELLEPYFASNVHRPHP